MTNKDLIKNYILFGIGPVISRILPFLILPFLTKYISPEVYGQYDYLVIISNLFLIVFLIGLDQAYYREYFDAENKKQLLSVTLFIVVISFIFMYGVMIVFKELIFAKFQIDLTIVNLVYIRVFIYGIERFVNIQFRVDKKGKIFSVLTVVRNVLSFLFMWLLVIEHKMGLKGLLLASIVTSGLTLIASYFYVKDAFGLFNMQSFKKYAVGLLRLGIPLVPAAATIWIMNSMDRYMIVLLRGYYDMGIYGIGSKFSVIFTMLQQGFTNIWPTYVLENYQKPSFNKKLNEILTISNLIYFVVLISFVLLIEPFFKLFMDAQYYAGWYVAAIIVTVPYLYFLIEFAKIGIIIHKKNKYFFYNNFIIALINLGLNYVLIKSMASIGAAIATTISYLVYLFLTLKVSANYIKVKIDKRNIFIFVSIGVYIFATVVFHNLILNIFLYFGLLSIAYHIFSEEVKKVFQLLKKSKFNPLKIKLN